MKIHSYSDFWSDSIRAIKRYIHNNFIFLPCNIYFFPEKFNLRYKEYGLIINRFDRVDISADKIKMNKYFDKIEIPHPKTFYKNSIWKRIRSRFERKQYIRKARFSSGGNGKKIFNRFPKFNPEKHYVQEFWLHPHHLRIYYLEGKPIMYCPLIGGKGDIRNYQYGWKYTDMSLAPTDVGAMCTDCELLSWANIIYKETNLNFFAFDIAIKGDEYKILEMNAMPDIRRRFRVRPFVRELIAYARRYASEGNVQRKEESL